MKKLTALWLSLLLAFGTLTGCAGQIGIIGGADGPTAIITSDSASAVSVTEDGQYDSKNEVAAYLTEYGHLPSNYITKKQAQALGWQSGSLEPYAPGCSIGVNTDGYVFVNGKLRAIKSGDGRNLYHELFVLFYPTAKE